MTLVLALRWSDGVVLVSDGQATSDAAGQPTRAPVRKLFDLGGRVAWGAAGSVGLQQTLKAELDLLNGHAKEPGELRRRLASAVVPLQQAAVRQFVPHAGAEPPELACLFCWCDADGPRILSIPRTGSDHQFHDRHAAIGSGDIFAELTVRSIAHLDGPELTLEQAKMIAYRAVSTAPACRKFRRTRSRAGWPTRSSCGACVSARRSACSPGDRATADSSSQLTGIVTSPLSRDPTSVGVTKGPLRGGFVTRCGVAPERDDA